LEDELMLMEVDEALESMPDLVDFEGFLMRMTQI
jgi:hypothetical protein